MHKVCKVLCKTFVLGLRSVMADHKVKVVLQPEFATELIHVTLKRSVLLIKVRIVCHQLSTDFHYAVICFLRLSALNDLRKFIVYGRVSEIFAEVHDTVVDLT